MKPNNDHTRSKERVGHHEVFWKKVYLFCCVKKYVSKLLMKNYFSSGLRFPVGLI